MFLDCHKGSSQFAGKLTSAAWQRERFVREFFLRENAFASYFFRSSWARASGTCCKMQLGKATNASGTVHMEILSGGGWRARSWVAKGTGGWPGRHYLCKGVERSLWNRGARLVHPYRSSMAERMLVPPSHPLPLQPPPGPLPATLSPGVALKYLGGAMA